MSKFFSPYNPKYLSEAHDMIVQDFIRVYLDCDKVSVCLGSRDDTGIVYFEPYEELTSNEVKALELDIKKKADGIADRAYLITMEDCPVKEVEILIARKNHKEPKRIVVRNKQYEDNISRQSDTTQASKV